MAMQSNSDPKAKDVNISETMTANRSLVQPQISSFIDYKSSRYDFGFGYHSNWTITSELDYREFANYTNINDLSSFRLVLHPMPNSSSALYDPTGSHFITSFPANQVPRIEIMVISPYWPRIVNYTPFDQLYKFAFNRYDILSRASGVELIQIDGTTLSSLPALKFVYTVEGLNRPVNPNGLQSQNTGGQSEDIKSKSKSVENASLKKLPTKVDENITKSVENASLKKLPTEATSIINDARVTSYYAAGKDHIYGISFIAEKAMPLSGLSEFETVLHSFHTCFEPYHNC